MVVEEVFALLKNTVIFDSIDRIWIPSGFQPSVQCKTASSTIFHLRAWKMPFLLLKIPGFYLLQHGEIHPSIHTCIHTYIYIHTHIHIYVYVMCMRIYVYMYIHLHICI